MCGAVFLFPYPAFACCRKKNKTKKHDKARTRTEMAFKASCLEHNTKTIPTRLPAAAAFVVLHHTRQDKPYPPGAAQHEQ